MSTSPVLGSMYLRYRKNGNAEVNERWIVKDFLPYDELRRLRRNKVSTATSELPSARLFSSLVSPRRPSPDANVTPRRKVFLFVADIADLPDAVARMAGDLGIEGYQYHFAEV